MDAFWWLHKYLSKHAGTWHFWVGETHIWEIKLQHSCWRVLTVKQDVISCYPDCSPCHGIITEFKLEWLGKPTEYLKGYQFKSKCISEPVSKIIWRKNLKPPFIPPLTNLFLFFNLIYLFMALPVSYRSSQARGWIRAISAGLCHSHGNARCKLLLLPLPQLVATMVP